MKKILSCKTQIPFNQNMHQTFYIKINLHNFSNLKCDLFIFMKVNATLQKTQLNAVYCAIFIVLP